MSAVFTIRFKLPLRADRSWWWVHLTHWSCSLHKHVEQGCVHLELIGWPCQWPRSFLVWHGPQAKQYLQKQSFLKHATISAVFGVQAITFSPSSGDLDQKVVGLVVFYLLSRCGNRWDNPDGFRLYMCVCVYAHHCWRSAQGSSALMLFVKKLISLHWELQE